VPVGVPAKLVVNKVITRYRKKTYESLDMSNLNLKPMCFGDPTRGALHKHMTLFRVFRPTFRLSNLEGLHLGRQRPRRSVKLSCSQCNRN
jgi:hypothetical protein